MGQRLWYDKTIEGSGCFSCHMFSFLSFPSFPFSLSNPFCVCIPLPAACILLCKNSPLAGRSEGSFCFCYGLRQTLPRQRRGRTSARRRCPAGASSLRLEGRQRPLGAAVTARFARRPCGAAGRLQGAEEAQNREPPRPDGRGGSWQKVSRRAARRGSSRCRGR